MKLRTEQILEEPTEVDFVEPVVETAARLEAGEVHDFRLLQPLSVHLTHQRSGEDLFLRGKLSSELEGTCARCLETFPYHEETAFDVVLVPAREADAATRDELSPEDLSLGYYQGEEIDLSALVAEQAILALPTRALCRDDCRGLCASCGVNLNLDSCECRTEPTGDPRLAALREWRGRAER